MLGGVGHTGVETHFFAIRDELMARGVVPRLITPYTGSRWLRAFVRPLKNSRSENAMLMYRLSQARFVELQLRAVAQRTPRERVIVYAQCPITARAALRAGRFHANWKSSLVVHYNQSEAQEIAHKGEVRAGGPMVRHLDRLEAEVLPRLGQIFFVSHFMQQIVSGRVALPPRVRQEMLHNFPAPPSHISAGEFEGDLIAIGTLEPRKNQRFLIEVLAELRRRGKPLRLGIVGAGPDQAALAELAKERGVADLIRFWGFQANAAKLIPRYRALAHASKMENCPISILESLSYGRPVLAASVGGIPELFSHRVEGCFWDLQNPAAAADEVLHVLDSPDRYQAMATAARENYRLKIQPLPQRWLDALLAPTATAHPA